MYYTFENLKTQFREQRFKTYRSIFTELILEDPNTTAAICLQYYQSVKIDAFAVQTHEQ